METWLPVVGYEDSYEVSSHGRVRSIPRVDNLGRPWPGCMLKLVPTKRGDHWSVSLSRNGINRTLKVHRMVAEAFIGPPPDGTECCHGNGDGFDNRVENLRWDTHQSNVRDSLMHGTHPKLAKTHCPAGHRYDDANTYRWVDPKTGRTSRACRMCRANRRTAKRSELATL